MSLRVRLGTDLQRSDVGVELDELIARHPEAYADHAAEFWLSVGGDPRRALRLARQNLTFRPTPRAHALVNRAMHQSLVAPIEPALGTTAVDA